MKKYLLLSLFALFSTDLFAQTEETTPDDEVVDFPYYGGMGGFGLGQAWINTDVFQQSFLQPEFSDLGNTFTYAGGYGMLQLGRLMIGGSGYALRGPEATATIDSASVLASMTGGMGFFEIGYAWRSKPNFKLYPFAGLGGMGLKLRISPQNQTIKAIDIYDNYKQEVTVESGSFGFNLGLGMNLLPSKPNANGTVTGPVIGLRAAYLLMLPSNSWNYGGGIIEGPQLMPRGFNVTLTLGGAGFALARAQADIIEEVAPPVEP